mmetsp:Transcript_17213/g.38942  ORF Transcript_17213/g.38942 Transcript_17213/m.38942 type:complete len:214 (+) Transcript_17213:1276-1917(+)
MRSAPAHSSIRITTGGRVWYCCMAVCRGVLPPTMGALTFALFMRRRFTASMLPPASRAMCMGVLKCGAPSEQLTSACCWMARLTSGILFSCSAVMSGAFMGSEAVSCWPFGLTSLLPRCWPGSDAGGMSIGWRPGSDAGGMSIGWPSCLGILAETGACSFEGILAASCPGATGEAGPGPGRVGAGPGIAGPGIAFGASGRPRATPSCWNTASF